MVSIIETDVQRKSFFYAKCEHASTRCAYRVVLAIRRKQPSLIVSGCYSTVKNSASPKNQGKTTNMPLASSCKHPLAACTICITSFGTIVCLYRCDIATCSWSCKGCRDKHGTESTIEGVSFLRCKFLSRFSVMLTYCICFQIMKNLVPTPHPSGGQEPCSKNRRIQHFSPKSERLKYAKYRSRLT